jgi:hypothetical protein
MIKVILVMASIALSCAAQAVELRLENVAAESARGVSDFSVTSDAEFIFDAQTSTLASSGTWVAQSVVGPSNLIRFAHKFENFGVTADGIIEAKSYECVEGTLGNIVTRSYCGNYNYGANLQDDGGIVDDQVIGPRREMSDYELGSIDWDDETLIVVLVNKTVGPQYIRKDDSLILTLQIVAP